MEPKQPAPALARGIELLSILDVEGQVSLENLTKKTGWPKSSVLRCLQSLEACGVVRRSKETKAYRALQRLVPIRTNFPTGLQAIAERLSLLSEQVGHAVELFVAQCGMLVMVDRAEPAGVDVHIRVRIGAKRFGNELDGPIALLTAWGGTEAIDGPYWQWHAGQKQEISAEAAAAFIAHARAEGVASDRDFNDFGVRRHARALTHGDTLIGVLTVAQNRQVSTGMTSADAIVSALRSC